MTDRDPATGRFLPGNRAAEGNPSGTRGRPKRYATEYADELSENLTLEAWGRIVQKSIEQAIAGDHRAREFLASYVMGEPVKMVVADINGDRDRLMKVVEDIRRSLPEVEGEAA